MLRRQARVVRAAARAGARNTRAGRGPKDNQVESWPERGSGSPSWSKATAGQRLLLAPPPGPRALLRLQALRGRACSVFGSQLLICRHYLDPLPDPKKQPRNKACVTTFLPATPPDLAGGQEAVVPRGGGTPALLSLAVGGPAWPTGGAGPIRRDPASTPAPRDALRSASRLLAEAHAGARRSRNSRPCSIRLSSLAWATPRDLNLLGVSWDSVPGTKLISGRGCVLTRKITERPRLGQSLAYPQAGLNDCVCSGAEPQTKGAQVSTALPPDVRTPAEHPPAPHPSPLWPPSPAVPAPAGSEC